MDTKTSTSVPAQRVDVEPPVPDPAQPAQLSHPGVDVQALTDLLDGRFKDVRAELRAALATGRFTAGDLSSGEHRAWARARTLELAALPAPHRAFPSAFGGHGDASAGIAAFEMLAHGDLSLLIKMGVQWGLFGGAILHLGTAEHHELLGRVQSGELLGCFAMTESNHGSDVSAVQTTATFDPLDDEFVVNTPTLSDRKDYIGNAAADGHLAVVFAQLYTLGNACGVHAFLVPIRVDGAPAPGVTISDCGTKEGLAGVDNGRLSFDHVRIPRTNLLDRYGHVNALGEYSSPIASASRRFFTMLGTLVQGRVSIAGSSLSATKNALAIAIGRANTRRQFGAPDETLLLDYRAHQRRLLPKLAEAYAFHFAQAEVLGMFEAASTDSDRRILEARVAGHKAATSWFALNAIDECRQACGGWGYLFESGLPRLRSDVDVFTTFEGDNTVLLQLVGKSLLTSAREQFSSMDVLSTLRLLAGRVGGSLVEATIGRVSFGVLTRRTESESRGILSRAWHLDLFEHRAAHTLDSLGRRLSKGRPTPELFNSAQDHLLVTAKARVELDTYKAFAVAVKAAPANHDVLGLLLDLYALSALERSRGWFLEHEAMSTSRSRALQAAINDLCVRIRPLAADLVGAWAIPDACLRPGA